MNLYIDEHYDDESNETLLALLFVSEQRIISVYKSLKKIITKKELNYKVKRFLLSELKSNKLKRLKYFGDIVNAISSISDGCTYIVIPFLPRDGKKFQEAYASVMKDILKNEDAKIFADEINNKNFMRPIIDTIDDDRFQFYNSEKVKGIQLADILTSLYKENEK